MKITDREHLIQKLKYLISVNDVKQKEYQHQNNVSSECGFLTREAFAMASLLPKMQQLGGTFDDCK